MPQDQCPQYPDQDELNEQLSGEEDPDLAFGKDVHSSSDGSLVKLSYKRPPGIKTLADWSQVVLPKGTRHENKTFRNVVVTEPAYCQLVANRAAKSAWLKSFQNYLRALENARRKSVLQSAAKASPHTALPSLKDLDWLKAMFEAEDV